MNAADCPDLASRHRRVRSANVGRTVLRVAAAAGVIALALITSACTRPMGDFERARPDATHDSIMPTVGGWRAKLNGEPVSDFNLTDQETEMHDRVWRFLIAAHSKDWFYDLAVELKRTRLSTASDTRFALDRYYKWLHQTQYASSRVRYATVLDDVNDDIATLPDTFKAICAVIEIDQQRALAARSQGSLGEKVNADMVARREENEANIGWFTRALDYRYQSYNYALDLLLVETPHEEAQPVDIRLGDLEAYVQAAKRRDFCGRVVPGSHQVSSSIIPSRYSTYHPDAEQVVQK